MATYPRVTIQVPIYDMLSMEYTPRPTEGWMVGQYLAVHRGIASRDCWTVTHVPTGRALELSLVSKRAALRLAHRVQHLNWNFHTVTSRVAKATIRLAKPLVRGEAA